MYRTIIAIPALKFPLTLSELKNDHVYLPDTTDIGRRQSTCIIVSEKIMHLAQP